MLQASSHCNQRLLCRLQQCGSNKKDDTGYSITEDGTQRTTDILRHPQRSTINAPTAQKNYLPRYEMYTEHETNPSLMVTPFHLLWLILFVTVQLPHTFYRFLSPLLLPNLLYTSFIHTRICTHILYNLMFIGPCIIVIAEE